MSKLQNSNNDRPPSTPLWVKVFGIIAIVLFLLVIIHLLTGEHGPGMHGLGSHESGEEGGDSPAGDGL